LRITITKPNTNGTYNTDTGGLDLEGTLAPKDTVTHLTCANDRGNSITFTSRASFYNGTWSCRMFFAVGANRITATAYDIWGNSARATLNVNYNVPAIGRPLAGNPRNIAFGGPALSGYSGDGGPAFGALLSSPEAVALDAAGNLYIADTGNHRIRKVTPQGVISTLAGDGLLDGLGDGGSATAASLNTPRGVAVDAQGNVYIADTGNHRLRKVTPQGIISTVAGTGVAGFGGDGSAALNAQLNTPLALAVDAAGNVYFSDFGNHRVRKLTVSTGIISSVIGGGYGFGGDGGPAATAKLSAPRGVAVDAAGNLYVADSDNRRVRKVTPAGLISTVVGNGQFGAVFWGQPAINSPMNSPKGVAVDAAGNLYVTDFGVDRVGADGIINHVAGNNVVGTFLDDGGHPGALLLGSPPGVAVDRSGNLYIADQGNHRVVVVTQFQNVTSTHAASFTSTSLASESIVAAFGVNLATITQSATTLPLPTVLGGASVRVRDSQGAERFAPLFFVSPTQINYQIPPGTASGPATLLVSNGQGAFANGSLLIEPAAPGLFAANATGQGVAAATVLRVRGDGSQSFEPVAVFDTTQNKLVARAINFGAANEQLFLILFGTGLRQNVGVSAVTAQIGGEPVEVLFAGAQGSLVGLDQINLTLPRSLIGRGEVDVVLSVDGKAANTVRIALAGAPCNFQITPPNQPIPATGGTVSIGVSTSAACVWGAQTNATWLAPASTGYRSGNGTASFTAAANPSPLARTAEIKLAAQTVTVTQAGTGDPPPSLTIISPTTSGAFTTSLPVVNLRGTASAAAGVALLTWSNQRGGSGFASGTINWGIENLPLQPGVNELTITAYDNLGRSTVARFVANFQPEFRIQTVAGGGNLNFSEGSRALDINLSYVEDVAVDAAGNVYFSVTGRILKLNSAGLLTTFAGNGQGGVGADNVPATASAIAIARGLAFDRNGNLYFSEGEYRRVRKIDAATGIVTTVVGGSPTGTAPGDGGPASQAVLQFPTRLTFDSAGNLYIADYGDHRVRKVEAATGIIRTIAGNGMPSGALGDGGPATAAVITNPFGVKVDRAGNVYISDAGRVRCVSAMTGVIVTVAGGGQQSGEDLPATAVFLIPRGLALDAEGNLIIAEYDHRVRRVALATDRITTIAGSSERAFGGDGGPALFAYLNDPQAVTFDRAGNLYIADSGNGRIRKLTPWAVTSAAFKRE
jgi:uncharacterized protein (TIGR03437 family)